MRKILVLGLMGGVGLPGGEKDPAPDWGGISVTDAYRFDSRRWTPADWITGAASLVVLIALFLPWYSVNLATLGVAGSASESGTDAHGWLWLVFVVVLLMLAYLVVAAGYQELPFHLPWPHKRLLLGAAGLNLLLVVIAFVFKPGNDGEPVQIGWSFGAVLALIAAIAATLPLVLDARRPALSDGEGRGT
jgi:hypothetical protein